MIVYSSSITARLKYIGDFIGKELTGQPFQLTDNRDEFINFQGPRINYSAEKIITDEFWLQPHTLLFEQGIKQQAIECCDSNGQKAFFKTGGDFAFDVFAASFYLLSRYEEYLPHENDMYGRYAFENSLAYREKFLSLPLINIWLEDFKKVLKQKLPSFIIPLPGSLLRSPQRTDSSSFTFLPTYDIDIAWSYKHKGFWRTTGGLIRSLFKGEWSLMKERIKVLAGKQKDPFDCYGWLNQLHEQNKLKPYYFFLVPEKRGRYDKNISPSCKAMQYLIQDHVIRYPIGIHPSWKSGDKGSLLKDEIETLSRFNGSRIVSSRQHYIRFKLPEGYKRLIDNGIKFDFSMGYGSINGFRASVALPFYWYDLEKEQQTDLLLFPFCYMEANSFYEQKYSAQQALEEMKHYYNAVKSVNGYFIMIWHNSFLGTDRLYQGWREVYEEFIKEAAP